jgi:hypothetical protein
LSRDLNALAKRLQNQIAFGGRELGMFKENDKSFAKNVEMDLRVLYMERCLFSLMRLV